MTKREFCQSVKARGNIDTGLGAIEKIYEIIFSVLAATLDAGESFSVRDFGTFSVVDVKERQGVNPQTGEKMTIPAHKKVKFKASKTLSDAVK